jgi:hypothetical protein
VFAPNLSDPCRLLDPCRPDMPAAAGGTGIGVRGNVV